MNEGHSALLTLALLERQIAADGGSTQEIKIDSIRRQCVFTTHTPVPAGHDAFPNWLVRQVLGEERTNLLFSTKFTPGDELNMTHLALNFSNYVNGVAKRHGEVSREIAQLYGDLFLNPPSTPMLIVDRKGGAHPLPFGIKSAESLQEALAPFLNEGM